MWTDAERYLSDHDVTVGRSASFDEAVQDVLRNLGGFTAARRSPDDHHRVVVDSRHDLLLKLFDRQLIALHQDLNHRDFTLITHSSINGLTQNKVTVLWFCVFDDMLHKVFHCLPLYSLFPTSVVYIRT